ncbi:hypothetical protein [Sediminicoccus rosea]|uniref:Uncharacterized protein n=1 Tax=Sediminicoccus rosea TaxID=1225128 RepID=A0ABZ0PCB1_9PROT|nr:hypothetical protein [Sediminicoccus rosea]WPB83097.1 hypothetical protein R9Z33_13380 [Sediminicoccus rosea]
MAEKLDAAALRGKVIRLHILPKPEPYRHMVCIGDDVAMARPEGVVAGRGKTHALLTHDEGRDWPNAMGEVIALDALEHEGVVILAFETMRDARAALRRATGEGRAR